MHGAGTKQERTVLEPSSADETRPWTFNGKKRAALGEIENEANGLVFVSSLPQERPLKSAASSENSAKMDSGEVAMMRMKTVTARLPVRAEFQPVQMPNENDPVAKGLRLTRKTEFQGDATLDEGAALISYNANFVKEFPFDQLCTMMSEPEGKEVVLKWKPMRKSRKLTRKMSISSTGGGLLEVETIWERMQALLKDLSSKGLIDGPMALPLAIQQETVQPGSNDKFVKFLVDAMTSTMEDLSERLQQRHHEYQTTRKALLEREKDVETMRLHSNRLADKLRVASGDRVQELLTLNAKQKKRLDDQDKFIFDLHRQADERISHALSEQKKEYDVQVKKLMDSMGAKFREKSSNSVDVSISMESDASEFEKLREISAADKQEIVRLKNELTKRLDSATMRMELEELRFLQSTQIEELKKKYKEEMAKLQAAVSSSTSHDEKTMMICEDFRGELMRRFEQRSIVATANNNFQKQVRLVEADYERELEIVRQKLQQKEIELERTRKHMDGLQCSFEIAKKDKSEIMTILEQMRGKNEDALREKNRIQHEKNGKIEAATRELNESTAENQRLSEQNKALEIEIEVLKKHLDKNVQDRQEDTNATIEELRSQNEALKRRCKVQDETELILNEEVQNLKRELASISLEKDNLRNQVKGLTAQVKNVAVSSSRNQELEEMNHELKQRVEDFSAELLAFKKGSSELRKKVAAQEVEIAGHKPKIESLSSLLAARDEKILKLESDVDKYRASMNRSHDQTSSLQRELDGIMSSSSSNRTSVELLQKKLRLAEEALRKQGEDFEHFREEQLDQAVTLQSEIHKQQVSLSFVEGELRKAKQAQNKVESLLHTAEEQLAEKEFAINTLKAELRTVLAREQSLKTELEGISVESDAEIELRAKIEKLHEQVSKSKQAQGKLETLLCQSEEQLSIREEKEEVLEAKISELRARLQQELSSQNSDASAVQALQDKAETAQNEVAILQKTVSIYKVQLVEMSLEREKLINQVSEDKDEARSLMRKLKSQEDLEEMMQAMHEKSRRIEDKLRSSLAKPAAQDASCMTARTMASSVGTQVDKIEDEIDKRVRTELQHLRKLHQEQLKDFLDEIERREAERRIVEEEYDKLLLRDNVSNSSSTAEDVKQEIHGLFASEKKIGTSKIVISTAEDDQQVSFQRELDALAADMNETLNGISMNESFIATISDDVALSSTTRQICAALAYENLEAMFNRRRKQKAVSRLRNATFLTKYRSRSADSGHSIA